MWAECVPIALLYSALTMVLAYPLTIHPASSVLQLGADTDLFMWALGWDVHALTHRPLSVFDANIYYPYRHTLAYSENFIGSALLAAPFLWLTGNLALAMNAVALLSCVLCGVGAYVLARRVGIGPLGAALGGLIFAFAPPRFFRLGQLHLTTVQWLPFCLASLHTYLDSGRRRDLWLACTFFTLQVLTSGHGAVFVTLSVGALLAWRMALGEPLMPAKRLRDLGVPGALLLAISVLVLLPYLAVQQEMGLRRSLGESYRFSPSAGSFLASPTHVHAFLLSLLTDAPLLQTAQAVLFPGYLTLVLAATGLWAGFVQSPHRVRGEPATVWTRVAQVVEIALLVGIVGAVAITAFGGFRLRYGSAVIFSARQPWRVWLDCAVLAAIRAGLARRAPLQIGPRLRGLPQGLRRWADSSRPNAVAFYTLLTLISLWLSLGPQFGLYRWVYNWPGFSFIRVPTRFTLVALLGLAVLAAAGFERWTVRFAPKKRLALATLAGAVLVGEFAALPLKPVPYTVEIPPIDRWLATQPKPFVVAELPLASPSQVGSWERRHSLYMLHSMAHWQRTIHGYSGMRPALHRALYAELTSFPDENSLARLADLGVNYVVIHADLYPPGEWSTVEGRIDRVKGWLTLEHAEGTGRVYSLRRPPR